jgi:hypothetical protein
MRDIHADAAIALRFAQLGGNLDLSGAELATLDLRGAAIVGEMRLGDRDSVVHWAASRDGANSIDLDLRNAHVGSLSDNKDSWPTHLRLDGFTFARLGGFQGESSGEMVEQRGADWWDRNFARRDDFHPSPYEQLAGVFVAAGERDAAEEIRYDEQVRADESISWADPIHVWRWLLRWGAGYGIGSYMFRALKCAVGLSIIGAIFLRYCANKGVVQLKHRFWWCFGASVNRLLPVLSLKKEFVDFFDDPTLHQFKPWQDFVFVALAFLGWVLGLIVVAAFATITHGT